VNDFPGPLHAVVMTYDDDFEAHFADALDWHQVKYEEAVRKIMIVLERYDALFTFYRAQNPMMRSKNGYKVLSLVKSIQEFSGIERKRYVVTGDKYYKAMIAMKLVKKLDKLCSKVEGKNEIK
jgi:hypothetical protein